MTNWRCSTNICLCNDWLEKQKAIERKKIIKYKAIWNSLVLIPCFHKCSNDFWSLGPGYWVGMSKDTGSSKTASLHLQTTVLQEWWGWDQVTVLTWQIPSVKSGHCPCLFSLGIKHCHWNSSEAKRTILCIPGVWHISVVSQAVADKHIKGMFLVTQISQFLITFIENHAWKKVKLQSVS